MFFTLVEVALILLCVLALVGVVGATLCGRLLTRREVVSRIHDCRNELSDRTADRDGWREFSKDLMRRNNRLVETNIDMLQELKAIHSALDGRKNVDESGK